MTIHPQSMQGASSAQYSMANAPVDSTVDWRRQNYVQGETSECYIASISAKQPQVKKRNPSICTPPTHKRLVSTVTCQKHFVPYFFFSYPFLLGLIVKLGIIDIF